MLKYILNIILISWVITTHAETCDTISIRSFFTDNYTHRNYSNFNLESHLKYNPNCQITLIDVPLLKTLLPNICFYQTILYSNYREFRDVKTFVAYDKTDPTKSYVQSSPLYYIDTTTLSIFYNLQVKNDSDKQKLVNEIGNLFAGITYEGKITGLINLNHKEAISIELWWGSTSLLFFNFYFDKDNKLENIDLENGNGGGPDMKPGYKRK